MNSKENLHDFYNTYLLHKRRKYNTKKIGSIIFNSEYKDIINYNKKIVESEMNLFLTIKNISKIKKNLDKKYLDFSEPVK